MIIILVNNNEIITISGYNFGFVGLDTQLYALILSLMLFFIILVLLYYPLPFLMEKKDTFESLTSFFPSSSMNNISTGILRAL